MVTTLVWLTLLLPWLGALAVWLIGDRRPRAQHVTAATTAVAAGVAALLLIPQASDTAAVIVPFGRPFGALTFVPDGLGVFLTVVATVIGSLAVIFSTAYMCGAAQLGRYYALVLLFIGSMVGLALSGSLLFLFVFWEMTAFCSYALIAFHNDDPKAVAGGIKALIVTQLGGVGLLAGILVAYAYLPDYQISTLLADATFLPQGVLAFVAFGFLLAAMAKSAQVPLHIWLPDAMEAPSPVSALIHAATMVNAGVYLLARFYPAFAGVAGWTTAVVVIGLLSALLAALMAAVATDLKRVLAYSTISQLGYMVTAVGVGGIFASQFHLLSHAVFKALLFLGAGAMIHALGTRDMRAMGGLWRQMRLTSVTFLLGAGALAGLPILNGFWSKELILESALAAGAVWVYAGLLLGAGITTFYTARMVTLVVFGAPQRSAHPAPPAMALPLVVLAAGTLTTWLLAGPFSRWLSATLPFHTLHATTTGAIVLELLRAPATYLALAVVAAGLGAWWQRTRLDGLARPFGWLGAAARAGFGGDRITARVVDLTQGAGATLQKTQTGQLNWNIAGVVIGLILVLALLAGGM